mgnify:CR=1 FL=1
MPRLRAALKLDNSPISPQAFMVMVRQHEAFLAGRVGGQRANGRFVTARNIVCRRRNLSDAEFTGADLEGADLSGCDLRRASFYSASLMTADLTEVDLRRGDLRGSRLGGARLTGSRLDEADLRSAVLCKHDEIAGLRWMGAADGFRGLKMNGADLSGAVAYAVDFSNCTLKGACLRGANLKNANFSNANMSGVDLHGANLEGVRLNGAILTGVPVARLRLPASALDGCLVDPTPEAWAEAEAVQAEVDRAEIWIGTMSVTGGGLAELAGKDLRPARGAFRDRTLPGMNATGAIGVEIDFCGSRLQAARFDGADLRGADFSQADLRGASFVGANLAHAQFEGAVLDDLRLDSGARRPTDFSGAILDGTGLAPARAAVIL